VTEPEFVARGPAGSGHPVGAIGLWVFLTSALFLTFKAFGVCLWFN
jgi:hypothetical protein